MPRGKADKTLALIAQMKILLKGIQPASVRAVCYQLFVKELITSMAKSKTNGVGVQLLYAREQGIIPWKWIVDETREVEYQPGWEDKKEFKEAMAHSYRRQYWQGQPVRVEVWSEKGTVRGTLKPILEKWGIDFRVMHGFSSATVLHDVIVQQLNSKVMLIVLYVGDRDPSGLYMVEEDLPSRLNELWRQAHAPVGLASRMKIIPVALTEKDCQTLPWFPPKQTDTRYKWFVEHHGHRAWELDALSPAILRRRVEQEILRQEIDWDVWERTEKCSQAEQASLENVLTAWQQLDENISVQATK
jgi:hypothetical protein